MESTTKVFPYHPQANPVETFMKPFGKTIKTVHYQNQYKRLALNQLLASHRATPHPATSHKPRNLIFQHSYTNHFPPIKPPADIITNVNHMYHQVYTTKLSQKPTKMGLN